MASPVPSFRAAPPWPFGRISTATIPPRNDARNGEPIPHSSLPPHYSTRTEPSDINPPIHLSTNNQPVFPLFFCPQKTIQSKLSTSPDAITNKHTMPRSSSKRRSAKKRPQDSKTDDTTPPTIPPTQPTAPTQRQPESPPPAPVNPYSYMPQKHDPEPAVPCACVYLHRLRGVGRHEEGLLTSRRAIAPRSGPPSKSASANLAVHDEELLPAEESIAPTSAPTTRRGCRLLL